LRFDVDLSAAPQSMFPALARSGKKVHVNHSSSANITPRACSRMARW